MPNLRVTCWNAKVNRPAETVVNNLGNLIQDTSPDIVCLQEAGGYIGAIRERATDGHGLDENPLATGLPGAGAGYRLRASVGGQRVTQCRCEDSVRPVSSMARRSFAEASWRNHSSQWPPTPWTGLRKRKPSRKPSLLQCQKVQNQTNCMVLPAESELRFSGHLYSKLTEEANGRACDR